ncbi:MAG: prolyl-tRNA synthetase associated domain-containing protein [Desulfovibrionaceae bacterium]|nr:prolyl-tRNA synthetase associated domain-containing protein [Desulfovibrionaceae bacterium]
MDRKAILETLEAMQIPCTLVEHPPVYTIEEMDVLDLPDADAVVKNLFVRDDKKKNYYLLVVRKDRTVNLKEMRTILGSRPLSFASEADLLAILGLLKGHVTPFGILNDEERRVQVVFDEETLSRPSIAVHPGDNEATVWLAPADLLKIIETHGNTVISVSLN